MRYIKVKRDDELIIYDINNYAEGFNFCIVDNRLYYGKLKVSYLGEIVKQADNLDELCDEFILIWNKNIFPYSTARQYERCGYGDLMRAIRYNAEYGHYLNRDFEIYGAIWASKGLIYVAKVNDEGVLELL